MNPGQYNPLAPEHFIGSARDYALLLRQGILRARASSDAPLRYLINGPPGIGKSQPVKMSAAEGIASMQRRIALLQTELANFQRLKEKEEVKRCEEAIAECLLRIEQYELQSGGLN